LRHRGPDETAVRVVDGDAVFAFQRLSIIDVAGSHQPLRYADGRYTLVCNGEIYNYLELRTELRSAGARFDTDGDTEVVAAAYHHWGPAGRPAARHVRLVLTGTRRPARRSPLRDRFGIAAVLRDDRRRLAGLREEGAAVPGGRGGVTCDSPVDLAGLAHYVAMQYVPEPRSLHPGSTGWARGDPDLHTGRGTGRRPTLAPYLPSTVDRGPGCALRIGSAAAARQRTHPPALRRTGRCVPVVRSGLHRDRRTRP
jgi:asparagine synthase (glutamine-hydrolysing)